MSDIKHEKEPADAEKEKADDKQQDCPQRVGLSYKDGTLAETVVDEGAFRFAVYKNGRISTLASLVPKEGTPEILPPFGLRALCDAGLVRFPSRIQKYGSPVQLVAEIRAFLHRYTEIPNFWEELIAHYVLMSWVFDRFTALPYLRFLGEPQTGKSRILQLCAALMFRPMVASGNITGPALFRLIDLVQGTMIVDEADFKDSNEWSDIIKILNTGYTVGFPIVRCSDARSAYTPVAFRIFGPKIISTRTRFSDYALETRCLTFETKEGVVPDRIPLQLPLSFDDEGRTLRNKLLLYRFENFGRIGVDESKVRHLEPRLGQIGASLYSVAVDDGFREELIEFLASYGTAQSADRPQAIVVQALVQVGAGRLVTVNEVSGQVDLICPRYGILDKDIPNAKKVGLILRSLGIKPEKKRVGYTFNLDQCELDTLARRYKLPDD